MAQTVAFIFLVPFPCPLNSPLTEFFRPVQSSCFPKFPILLVQDIKSYMIHGLGLKSPSFSNVDAVMYKL